MSRRENVSILCNGRYKEKTLLKSESQVRLKATSCPQDERVERNGGCEFDAVGATQNFQGRNLTRLDRVVWSIEGEETTIVQETNCSWRYTRKVGKVLLENGRCRRSRRYREQMKD
ncbi:hypothetical protein BHYA_0072g00050 [Botrytis hyacinthi]|uniref:Uncharacterized protein n=1 Tax=Botrytis hyacinthi TaxID=278943 RepID=A0A4Z1GT37_9HELO|nr:hypothetical protein BHYA_0072g00050 [Botrytis hyacinthi]